MWYTYTGSGTRTVLHLYCVLCTRLGRLPRLRGFRGLGKDLACVRTCAQPIPAVRPLPPPPASLGWAAATHCNAAWLLKHKEDVPTWAGGGGGDVRSERRMQAQALAATQCYSRHIIPCHATCSQHNNLS